MESLRIIVEVDLEEKSVYVTEQGASGAEYQYKDASDLCDKIKFYITNYYSKEINKIRDRGGENE